MGVSRRRTPRRPFCEGSGSRRAHKFRRGDTPIPFQQAAYSVFFFTSSLNSSTTLWTESPATSVAFTPVALSVAMITAAATAAAISTSATAAMTKRAKREKALRFAGAGGTAGAEGGWGADCGARGAGRGGGGGRP